MFGSRILSPIVALVALGCAAEAPAPIAAPARANNTVYEIFVRSFADSNADSVGDLRGLTSRLDSYLNDGDASTDRDLEVGILWLMPVFPSPTYHGNDVTDFRAVNPQYGTLDDLKTLVAEAHARGVRVILDVPFNHTSDQHPWFREALRDPSSRYRKYYRIEPDQGDLPPLWHRTTTESGERVRYLGVFNGGMPDLDFWRGEVRDEIKQTAAFWLSLGVDGFRLDAAKHIHGGMPDPVEPEILANNDWWRDFSRFVYTKRPDAVLVGEVLGSRGMLRRHAWGLDGLLDEPFMHEARQQAAFPASGFVGRFKDAVAAARSLNREGDQGDPGPKKGFDPFAYLASHDENPRLASWLVDAKSRGMAADVEEAYRVAAYLLFMLPSYAIVYEGDELMQRGWKWNGNPTDAREPGDGSRVYDETLREPFPWYRSGSGAGQTKWFSSRFEGPNDGVSREEQDRPGGMLDLMRALTNLRAEHPALDGGDVGAVATDSAEWMVFERTTGEDTYLVLVNPTGAGNSYRFHEAWFPQYRDARLVFWSDGAAKTWRDMASENQRIDGAAYVPARGLVVLRRST
jgi:alpha-amylase